MKFFANVIRERRFFFIEKQLRFNFRFISNLKINLDIDTDCLERDIVLVLIGQPSLTWKFYIASLCKSRNASLVLLSIFLNLFNRTFFSSIQSNYASLNYVDGIRQRGSLSLTCSTRSWMKASTE